MYNAREKTCRDDEIYKSRKNPKNMPSFSSSLLDEIYRSFDGNEEKSDGYKAYREKPVKRQGGHVSRVKTSSEDEEMGSFRRACLVGKWMEKKGSDKVVSKRRPPLLPDTETRSLQDNDLMFFSSTSSSSDSSGALSSSDTEFFGSSTKTRPPKVSCFSTRPKPVRTGVDSYRSDEKVNRVDQDDLIKSKSRALKIYANLKKVKQPISPGGRLTSFINSLFSNANGKKSKIVDTNNKVFQDLKSPTPPSTCSSASSFSRSCLSKYSPRSREMMRNGAQRTVRFHPVSVIVDEDSRPCGHKCISNEEIEKYGRPPLPPAPILTELKTKAGLKGYSNKRVDQDEEDDEDDCMCDSSSDLFELDHLALFGDKRFCEELPVYETTHFVTNRAIASGLIR